MQKIVDIKDIKGTRAAGKSSEKTGGEASPAREYNRTPWSGNLDNEELARPGGLLLAALIHCANERRQQLNEMSDELGVTYGYVNQLRNGIRKVHQVSDEFALACARYLGVPRLTVLMMAGRVTPEDIFESEEMMATEVPRAMAYICDDPNWGHMVTPELRNATLHSQFLIVRLYEKATGKALMDKALDPEKLTAEILKLKEIQAKRTEVLEASARKSS